MCAGGGTGDSCAGDSGSALMQEVITETRQFDPRLVQVTLHSGPRQGGILENIHCTGPLCTCNDIYVNISSHDLN